MHRQLTTDYEIHSHKYPYSSNTLQHTASHFIILHKPQRIMGNDCRKASAHDKALFAVEGAANINASDRFTTDKNQHERPTTSSSSSRRSKSKRRQASKNEKLGRNKNPPLTGKSAESFGREDDEAERQRKRMQGVGMFTGEDWDQHEPVMITDYLSDVRERYHVSPKE